MALEVGVGMVGDGVIVKATVGMMEGMSRGLATGVGEAVGLPEEHPASIIMANKAITIFRLICFSFMVHHQPSTYR